MACSDVEMTDTHTHAKRSCAWWVLKTTNCVCPLHQLHCLASRACVSPICHAWRTLHSRQVRMHLAEVEQALAAIACCIACQKLDLWTVHRFRLKGIFPYKYIKIHQDTSSKSGQGMVWQSIYYIHLISILWRLQTLLHVPLAPMVYVSEPCYNVRAGLLLLRLHLNVGSKYMMGHGPRISKDAQGFCADQQWCCNMLENVWTCCKLPAPRCLAEIMQRAVGSSASYRNSWRWEVCSCPRPLHSMDFHN